MNALIGRSIALVAVAIASLLVVTPARAQSETPQVQIDEPLASLRA